MPGHDRDFTGAVFPDMKLGQPVFGGYRFHVQLSSKVMLAVGDNLSLRFAVPGDEYWRMRAWFVTDSTKDVTSVGQGWRDQRFQLETAGRWISGEADAADPRPDEAYTKSIPAKYDVWMRAWDGVTYLAWTDVNGVWLNIGMKDPPWAVTVLPPGSIWTVRSTWCEFASGIIERGFNVTMLVDRYIMPANLPDDPAEVRLWWEHIQFAQAMQGQG